MTDGGKTKRMKMSIKPRPVASTPQGISSSSADLSTRPCASPTTTTTTSSVSFFARHKHRFRTGVGGALKMKIGAISPIRLSSDTSSTMSQSQTKDHLCPASPPSQVPPPPPIRMPCECPSSPSPTFPSSQPHTQKLNSLTISPNLDALLKHDETIRQVQGNLESRYDAHTNPPPSPITSSGSRLQLSIQTTSLPPHSSYSSRSPTSSSTPPSSANRGTPISPSSSSTYNWSPFSSPARGRSTWGHTPNMSVASLSFTMDSDEPILKSLPPPPRPSSGGKRRATAGDKVKIPLSPLPNSPLRGMTTLTSSSELMMGVNTTNLSRHPRTVAEESIPLYETETEAGDSQEKQLGPLERRFSETEPLKWFEFLAVSDSEETAPSSLASGPLVPDTSHDSPSLIPIASSTSTQNRTSCASDFSSLTNRSSDSTATVTPGMGMEKDSTVPIRMPSLPPIPLPQKLTRHSLRSSKSAHNLGHRSARSTPPISSDTFSERQREQSRPRVLSAEDVLGELFRKEDALESLRILAQTGVMDAPDEVSPPLSRSNSRYNRYSGVGARRRSRSTQGTGVHIETSFLRMALEEEEEDSAEHGERYQDETYSIHSTRTAPRTPRLYPSPSTEVSVIYLDDEHRTGKGARHPYSSKSGSGTSTFSVKSNALSGKSSVSRSSNSTTWGPSNTRPRSGGPSSLKMGSRLKSTEGYDDGASDGLQGVKNGDAVSRRNQYRRRRPTEISLISRNLQLPAFSFDSGVLPQLPKFAPPSPLSASFERTLSLSGYPLSGSSVQLEIPSPPVSNQVTPDSEELSVSSRQDRISLATFRSESEESCDSLKSISTLAFGKPHPGRSSRKSRETNFQEIPIGVDSEKYSSSNELQGYEGDYNSASAEESTDEFDPAQHYQRRASEDLHHILYTYRSTPTEPLKKIKGAKEKEKTVKQRRKTAPALMSFHSSGEDQRYLGEVQIIDIRPQREQLGRLEMLQSSTSHAERSGSTVAQPPNLTTSPASPATTTSDGISTSLSVFQFVDEDPWSSTEHESREDEPRISISSTVYSQSYYDPFDVLPTPRSAQTFINSQAQRRPQLPAIDTMRSDRNNYSEIQDQDSFISLASPIKPPIPTSPKPNFERFSHSLERRKPNREREQGPMSTRHKHSAPTSRSSSLDDGLDMQPPPTSNNLDPLSRADLVRKSRKLAQVFGQTPDGASLLPPMSASTSDIGPGTRTSFLDITSPTASRHRASNSIAVLRKSLPFEIKDKVKANVERVKGKGIWPPPPTQYMSASSGRRHSTPLTPDEFEFLSELHHQEPVPIDTEVSSVLDFDSGENIEIGSVKGDRASFIDWDDDAPKGDSKGKSAHPVELLTQSPHSSENNSRRSSLSSLTFAPLSAYPGGAPRNTLEREQDVGLSAAPFDDIDDEGESRHQRLLARQPSLFSIVTPSLMSPEERAEAEKRRRREKLAKLHRFLGSRVPTGLVLGESEDSESGLPGISASSMGEETDIEGSGEEKRSWKKGMARVTRRKSDSESGISSDWSDVRDRRKEDLGEDERLRMVKRAVRLEKVFGVAPPQTLYQTHAHEHALHSHSTSGLVASLAAPKMVRSSSTGAVEMGLASSPIQSKGRPASRELLLPRDDKAEEHEGGIEVGDAPRSGSVITGRPRGASLVYTHYEHSLNSLGDILDRDDRESLKELHNLFYQDDQPEPELTADFHPEANPDMAGGDSDPLGYTSDYGSAYGGSIRSERRRSLPTRTSVASLASLGSIVSKMSNDAGGSESDGTFQVRRRRAAKLTQFFGVHYRDLVRDVLESIENGVELERGKGRIDMEEAEDLLRKLRTIKGKRTGVL